MVGVLRMERKDWIYEIFKEKLIVFVDSCI